MSRSKLDFRYETRCNEDMYEDLFDLTLEVSKRIKGGILVFFTSYAMMRDYLAYWKITGLLRKFKE